MVEIYTNKDEKIIDKCVTELGDFLLKNTDFFDVISNIINFMTDRSKFTDINYKMILMTDPLIKNKVKQQHELYNLVTAMYKDSSDCKISDYRGEFVEYVMSKLCPLNEMSHGYNFETEGRVRCNGVDVSCTQHDIDLLYYCSHNSIFEGYECKVKAHSYLYDHPPFSQETTNKLDYIKAVLSKLNMVKLKTCNIACIEANADRYRNNLDKYGYQQIGIMMRNEIKGILLSQ